MEEPTRHARNAFVTCEHTHDCCSIPRKALPPIGKKWATALAGFIAGAVVVTIILYPWLYFIGVYCPSGIRP